LDHFYGYFLVGQAGGVGAAMMTMFLRQMMIRVSCET
jgi:hypothetical protein